MFVAVLIPWRTANSRHRARALEYVTARYAQEHPDWPVVIGRHDEGPWCKAAAVADALAQTQAAVLILADADVWTEGLAAAVERVGADALWAVPHRGLHRLTEEATGRYMGGEPVDHLPIVERVYTGFEGGGITVLRREVYEACPLDPRFRGWGSEDDSWSWALRELHGTPWRATGYAPMAHLWHPSQPRAQRSFGSMESRDLRKRYARARGRPAVMAALIEEAKAHELVRAAEPPDDACPTLGDRVNRRVR